MSKKIVKWNDVCNRNDACALSGAAAWAAGIKNSQILVNGPLWCYFYAMRQLDYNDVEMCERMHMTQLDNTAIVYGSEKCIQEGVDRILENGRPELLFIENNCSAGLIGDDLLGIARSLDLDMPCVAMDSGGTIGLFAEGFSKACVKTMELFAKQQDSFEKRPLRINLVGMTRYYYNGVADFDELERMLVALGYEVNRLASVSDLKEVAQASLNLVCHEELGLEAAQYLEKLYGTPYLCAGLPYGCHGTRAWLARINEALPAPKPKALEGELNKMELYLSKKNSDMRTLWDILAYDKILVAGPGTIVQSMADTLRREWLDTDELVILSQQRLSRSYCELADKLLFAGEDEYSVTELCACEPQESCLLIGSSSEYMELRQAGIKRLARIHIAMPANDAVLLNKVPYMGILGAANMQQQLWNSFVEMKLRQ